MKLIIFDCDGVLVDSEVIGNRITSEMLTQHGYAISLEETIKKFTGISDKSMCEIVYSESGILVPKNFSETMQKKTVKAFEDELKAIMSPILENPTLRSLKKCVASSSPRHRVLRSLELTNQNHFFSDIFTAEEVKNGKPAPDLFLHAAKKMACVPHQCLVIEDSIAGITAALNASMKVIGFLGGQHAKYSWYKDKVNAFKIPIAHNTDELLNMILSFSSV